MGIVIYEQTDGAQQKAEDQDRKLMTDRFHEQAPVGDWIKKIYEKRGEKIRGKVWAVNLTFSLGMHMRDIRSDEKKASRQHAR